MAITSVSDTENVGSKPASGTILKKVYGFNPRIVLAYEFGEWVWFTGLNSKPHIILPESGVLAADCIGEDCNCPTPDPFVWAVWMSTKFADA